MKVVQIPSKLWIGTYEFPLRLVPPDDPHLQLGKVDDEEREGMTLTGDAVGGFGIWIANNLALRQRLNIVWHEVTHAINWVHDIDDADGAEHLAVDEETLATKHGVAWPQFLLDNPRYVSWVTYTLDRIRKAQRSGDDDANDPKPLAAEAPVTAIG